MADVEHSVLTGTDLHEPKGAAAAVVDSIYMANGAGSGSWRIPIKKFTAVLTPASVAANSAAEQTFTVAGVLVASDFVLKVHKPTHQNGLVVASARVTADNTVAIVFTNVTSSPIVPTAAQTYTFFVNRS